MTKHTTIATLLTLSPLAVWAQTAAGDSVIMRTLTVTAQGQSALRTDSTGATLLSTAWLERMPKVLGNADPIRLMQTLPGVHTNAEYDGGLYVNGGEASHSVLMMGGAPIYGATHLLGFFSVFNPTHFSAMHLRRATFNALTANRLGAELDMMLPDSTSMHAGLFEGTLGLMSAQGTLRLRPTNRCDVVVSARRSFLNLLYGGMLKMDEMDLEYGFGDYNATVLYRPSSTNTLTFNLYYGNDNADMLDKGYQADVKLKWSNTLAQAGWTHDGHGWNMSHMAYVSHFANSLNIHEEALSGNLRSDITDTGYEGTFATGGLTAMLRLNHWNIRPQTPVVDDMQLSNVHRSYSNVATLGTQYSHHLRPWMTARAGIKAHAYGGGSNTLYDIDPTVGVTLNTSWLGWLDISLGAQTQHLGQTGFSSRGLPTEFWLSPAETGWHAQRATGFDIMLRRDIIPGYDVEIGVYLKHMTHQIEYRGDLLSLLSTYRLDNHILQGKGYNAGVNVLLRKTRGRVTGWMSYSWQRARRRFNREGMSGTYPSNHERPHELNIVANWRIAPRLDLGACLVYASGTPFTAPTEMYMINGNIVMQYGEHNSSRLPSYMRLDLSLNYDFRTRGTMRHGLNLSLYNTTVHDNAIFYRLRYRRKDNAFAFAPLAFALPIMPSISYYIKL